MALGAHSISSLAGIERGVDRGRIEISALSDNMFTLHCHFLMSLHKLYILATVHVAMWLVWYYCGSVPGEICSWWNM